MIPVIVRPMARELMMFSGTEAAGVGGHADEADLAVEGHGADE